MTKLALICCQEQWSSEAAAGTSSASGEKPIQYLTFTFVCQMSAMLRRSSTRCLRKCSGITLPCSGEMHPTSQKSGQERDGEVIEPQYFDTHTHLDDSQFASDIDAVIAEATALGVRDPSTSVSAQRPGLQPSNWLAGIRRLVRAWLASWSR